MSCFSLYALGLYIFVRDLGGFINGGVYNRSLRGIENIIPENLQQPRLALIGLRTSGPCFLILKAFKNVRMNRTHLNTGWRGTYTCIVGCVSCLQVDGPITETEGKHVARAASSDLFVYKDD